MRGWSNINFKMIIKFVGILLMMLSIFMVSSAYWSYVNTEVASFKSILISSAITFSFGLLLFFVGIKHDHRKIGKREGYIIVSLTWISISAFGALPFFISGFIPSYTDAFFETMSGFSTTGSSILQDVEVAPKGLLFWRSMTQWLGGMGIIVFTLAILPILGVGGMQLFIAEAPGTTPTRLHPKIADTAKRLWGIYIAFTLLQTSLMMLGGLDFFESINHAFTTMSTGGFSTKNDSIAAFSPYIQYVIIFFMILGGTSFTLNYFLLKGRINKVLENEEFKFYIFVLMAFSLAITTFLVFGSHLGVEKAFRDSLFQVVSIVTTTGFVTSDYLSWAGSLWFLIFILMFSGGCIGSTAGGIKMIRHLVLAKNMRLEFKRLIHPMAVLPIRVSGKVIPQPIINNFLAFVIIYITCIAMGSGIMTFFGLDFETAIGATIASIGNIGPGIGSVGPVGNYAHIPDGGKWVLSFLMLAGRLELFTVFLLLSPSFYKK